MNTILGTVLENDVVLAMTTLALLVTGYGLRVLAGYAGALIEQRLASRPGRR